MKLVDKDIFLEKYYLTRQELDHYNIDWNVLNDIHNDFIEIRRGLETQAEFIANTLRTHSKIHTVKTRVKDPEHLIEKIIRKTPKRQETFGVDFQFTVDNYRDEITDLIGIRAIYIFKEEWQQIHDFITKTWNVIEISANVREGDDTKKFQELGVKIHSRKSGYRSVHYLLEFFPTNQRVIAEVQVRTIFEEGYGEIDHRIRYPQGQVPEVLALNLLLFNRIVGTSDEMASFINLLKKDWVDIQEKYQSITKKNNEEIKKLKDTIEQINMKDEEKQLILSTLDKVMSNNSLSSIGGGMVSLSEEVGDIPY